MTLATEIITLSAYAASGLLVIAAIVFVVTSIRS